MHGDQQKLVTVFKLVLTSPDELLSNYCIFYIVPISLFYLIIIINSFFDVSTLNNSINICFM